MPPPISRGSMSFLHPRQTNPSRSRQFSTSSCFAKIGPESPKFIDIPRAVQPYPVWKGDVKGTLPPPRNLFSNSGSNKPTVNYLAFATAEPTSSRQLSDPKNDYVAWKRKMATSRRENLREGLVELHSRKFKKEKTMAYRSARKREDRDARVNAPEREDDRITSISTRAINRQLQRGNIADPNRDQRVAAATLKYENKAKSMVQERQDALHTLYIHARNFIVNEAQLDAEIAKVFVEQPFKDMSFDMHEKYDIWDAYGQPPSVIDMMNEVSGSQRKAVDYLSGPALPYGKRMQLIAEELTGGKMNKS